ncbi:MAG: hypothetical protein WD851_09680 [Pirellulales bacterium]
MILHGLIHNGMIVLDEHMLLSEGTTVEVQVIASRPPVPPAGDTGKDDIPTLAERLKDVIGILEDLPVDAARNHDHYLNARF